MWATLTVPQLSVGKSGVKVDPQSIAIAKIAVRFLLVGTLTVAGIIAFVGLYNWMYNEGNAQKTYANKERVGKMMVVITACFVLLALFRLWVPDYQTLAF